MAMEWVWTTLSLAALLFILKILFLKTNKKRLPPSPKGLPLIGHLHMLGKNPHHDLRNLSKQHGDIMFLRLGFQPNVIVSSPRAAELFVKENDIVFASRPVQEAAKYLSYRQGNLTYGSYGPYWRKMRKMCTLELLSNHKINSIQPMRWEELGLLINFIQQAAKDRVAVDISAKVFSLSANISCRMVFGKKYTDGVLGNGGFKDFIQEGMELLATPNFADFFPFLAAFDLQGLTRRMKANAKVFDQFLDKIVDEHIQNREKQKGQVIKDFVDTMLTFMESGDPEFEFTRSNLKAVTMEMLIASMDTSATAIEWIMTELLRHPQVLKKLQEEIQGAASMQRMVQDIDLDKLDYLDMVVRETFRLHPPVPLLLPHVATEECVIDGFHIPRKSRILINAWAIGRDPDIWTDPEMFMPERFMGSRIDLRGRDFELIPFGSGRRACPGMQLGITSVRMVVAQLVHCFDWELANGMLPNELDMTEHFGLVMSRANHLMAIPSYRLQK